MSWDFKVYRNEASFAVIRDSVIDQWRAYDVGETGYLDAEETRNLTIGAIYNLILGESLRQPPHSLFSPRPPPLTRRPLSSPPPHADKSIIARYVDALLDVPASGGAAAAAGPVSQSPSPQQEAMRTAMVDALRRLAVDLHAQREHAFREVKARVIVGPGGKVVGSELVSSLSVWLEGVLFVEVFALAG